MTVTDELRKMLDERGVEWWPMHDIEAGYYQDRDTEFVVDGKKYTAHEWGSRLTVYGLTPAQAIAATLGSGTCHNVVLAEMDEKAGKKYSMAMTALRFGGFMPEDEPAEFECSSCGETAKVDWETLYQMKHCPFCGARIVEVES